MRKLEICGLLVIGALAGCMTAAPMPQAGPSGAGAADRVASDFGGPGGPGGPGTAPIILDRTDLALGTTVEFHHLPGVDELQDAAEQFAIRHVVVVLPSWPQINADLSRFSVLPPEADAILVLPGYPPDRSALDAWNYARGHVRLIVVVDGPPMSPSQLDDLNTLRALERVVSRMPHASRSGFEHLQRPLSFVMTVD
jgi:hypothetical protein